VSQNGLYPDLRVDSAGRRAIHPIASLPREDGKRLPTNDHLISFLDPSSFEADQYRTLRHVVERLRTEPGFQVLAVTSSSPGEGKSLTTLNLAGALAQSRDARILLIDADLRRPAVAEYLGLADQSSPGLVEAITNPRYGLEETVRHLTWANLSVLPAGGPGDKFYELLVSRRLETLVGEARRLYDVVLIDTPPILPVPDCRQIGKWVDGFLFVVAADRTTRGQLAEALSLLDQDKVIGLIFNGVRESRSRYNDYYGYYHSHRSRSHGAGLGWWQRLLAFGHRNGRPSRW
jgi:capsular exopolysaccharide synthesis family protein